MVRLRLRTRSDLQSSKNWQGGLTYKKQEKGPRRALMTSPQCACLGTSLVSHWLSSGTPRLSKLLKFCGSGLQASSFGWKCQLNRDAMSLFT